MHKGVLQSTMPQRFGGPNGGTETQQIMKEMMDGDYMLTF